MNGSPLMTQGFSVMRHPLNLRDVGVRARHRRWQRAHGVTPEFCSSLFIQVFPSGLAAFCMKFKQLDATWLKSELTKSQTSTSAQVHSSGC